MKKFRFRLESLLDLRTKKSQTAKEALGEVIRQRATVELSKQERLLYLHGVNDLLTQGKVTVLECKAHIDHRSAVQEVINSLNDELKRLDELESVRRNHLRQAMIDEKAISTLREKKVVEYEYHSKKEEQDFLDDLAQQSGRRSRIG